MQLSQEKLQRLLEQAPQAIVIVDGDGDIVFANAQAIELFGYRQSELLGQGIETLIPKRLREIHDQHRTEYILQPRTRPMGKGQTLIARRKDGTEFPVEIGLSALETEGKTLVASYITDITPHRRAERALRQLNDRLERRTRQLTALHEIGRTLAATLDLREIYWVMYREIAQGLLGTPHLTVALFDRETETIHCGFAIVDGEEIDPTQLPPIPLGEGPVSDTIRSRESRIIDLREIIPHLKASGRGVQVGDERQAQSALYVPMVGGDEVVGVMHVQHYEANAFRETDLPLLSILASQAAVAITNAQLFATEQERADALARALEQQRELDRMKDQLIQNISHELRTPLGIIYGYAELLNSGQLGAPRPEHKEPIRVIARRVRFLRRMVEDITTLIEAETRAPKMEAVDLAALAQNMVEDFQVSAQQAGLTLSAEIPADLAPVTGDAHQLRHALDNLLSNALKFTPAGGSVEVRLWQDDADMVLEITDSGIGIPADKLDRIFERFYQVDGSTTRRYAGTGLGLALVKEIVTAHGGRVSVESVLGEGSTFRMRLPIKA